MIYLFDKDEKLFKIINKPALKTVLQKYALTTEQYVSDRLTVEMKSLDTDELEKVEYMAIQTIEDAHTFHYFYVAQKHTDKLTTLIGVQSGIEELRKTPVWDKRPKNAFAKNVINDLLKGTNWQARFVGETTQRSTSFYYISVFEALKKVCKVWDLEMQFFVEMNGNKIGARYIDFKRKIGSAVGKRVVYGHNALQILQEVERTNLFTALIGRGKGEQVSSAEESDKKTDGYGRKITFENVVWDVAKGNPVNKPKGQRFVELPEMTKNYGIKNTDGSIRPKIGFVDFQEEEDPGVLLERTYKALVDAARPQLTLKTTSAYLRGVKVGDTIRVVRHDKKLDYDTRIFEITFNRLNNESSDIKLGDRIGESNEAKAQTIAEKVVDDFVSNEFSDFVQKLPDFLPSPDGFNNNWYGTEDPTVKYPGKVLINDIWFKPDPEHEGHKIMLRWTGEVWDEIVRSYDKESLTKRISEEIANFDKTFQSVNEQNKKKIDEILQSSGASTLLAQEAKRISLDSIARLEAFKKQAMSAQTALSGDLDVLKHTVTSEVNQASEYRRTTTEALSRMTGQMNGFATKSEVAQGIDGLTETFSKMKVGGRNYAEDYDFSRGLWQYSQGDSSPKDWTILNGEYNVKGTTNTWKQMQIHSKEGSRASGKSSTALLELETGETYTLSFQGICYSGSPNVWVSLRANRTVPGNPEIINGNFNLTPSWQTYQVTIPALIKPDNFDFWRIILGYNGIGHVAFRKVELTRSSTRIDAGPAPEDGRTDLIAAKAIFERTAQGLRIDLSAIQSYVDKDGQRQEELKNYARNESITRINIYRQDVARNYILRSRYDEDAKSIRQQFEAITNSQNGLIATKIADYKHSVDGKFTDIYSRVTTYKQGTDNQISNLTTQVATNKDNAERQMGRISDQVATNKVNVDSQFANVSNQLAQKVETTDFQRVKETSQLYERILGNTENGITDKVARMAMTNQLFQVEVSKNENLKTVQRQLAGSWAVQNLTSAGSIVSQINATNNQILIEAEKIRLKGKTLLDELTAIQGYFKRLFVGEGTFATLNADVIRTNSITADKLVFNEALANRLVSNEIITSKLVASRAFVNALKAVTIDASQIVTGTLKGDRIYGGTIRGTDIYGATLTGHTKIQLGTYGSFDTVEGGLQINVPRTVNSKDGLGVQFIGSYGRGTNVPYGLYIYKDSDLTTNSTALQSDDFIMTVEGYIKAKGIGWFKTDTGSVNGKLTATIGLWNSNNVSLSFGGSGNDIYYSYNGTAYSLWSVVNQHFSDRRLKENIVECKHKALDYIHQFQFKEYDWKKQEDRPRQAHTKIGLIAQEVQAVDPTLVYENGDTLNLDNLRLTTIALKAIQELSQRIETLERKLA